MVWKCYKGKPIEFKGSYWWTSYHGGSMLYFQWVHKPYEIPIGKGFYVEPKLMHLYGPSLPPGYPVKIPSLPSDLNIIVRGPGLPKNGKEATLQWVPSACLSGTGKTFCRQSMGVQEVKSTSSASEFTIQFIGGFSEQQWGKLKGNVAFWRICYDGPFEMLMMAPLPDWRVLNYTMTFWWLINKIDEWGDAPDFELPKKPSTDPIEGTITELKEIRVPKDQEELRRAVIIKLEQIKAELEEVEIQLSRSNETESKSERLELRAVAIDILKRAHNLKNKTIKQLSDLEEALKKPIA